RYKAIQAPIPEVYDLQQDPGEWHNLLAGGAPVPPGARALFARLSNLERQDPFNHGGQQPGSLDEEERRKLAALGYLSGATENAGGPRIDPKIALSRANAALIDAGTEGKKRLGDGDFAGAIVLFHKVLTQNPEDLESTLCLAQAYEGVHDWSGALTQYRRALEIQPADAAAAFGAGSIFTVQGRPQEAERFFQLAIKADPRDVRGYLGMGNLKASTRHLDEAEKWLRRALEIDPNSGMATAALARVDLASGRRAEALALLERADQHDPNRHDVEALLGVLKAQTAEWDQAALHLKRAVDLDPADAASWDDLGVAYLRLNRLPEAAHCFETSLARNPAGIQASLNLGSLVFAQGDARRALSLAQEVLRRDPTLPRALALRAKAASALGSTGR
ncbi:MAG: tetratricopeptide repeat protein, partial [Thermoanaerobaculia bacterium]